MEKYKNEDNLKQEIMGQSRHLFIYGKNNNHRSEFLKSLESEYPIKTDSTDPVALYIDSIGLPKINADFKDKNIYQIHALSREFLSFTIATRILERSMELNSGELDERLSELISLINNDLNSGYPEIETTNQLLNNIKTTRDFYYDCYLNYVKGLIEKIPFDNVSIPFLELEMFIDYYKRAMNLNSYFGLIFDKKNPIDISSIKSINNLIGSRINRDMSVKLAVEPKGWDSYVDVNGQFIEAIHDYGTVELDESFKEYMNSVRRHF